MLGDATFRAGFAHLARLGLSYDAWLYFHQIPRLTALARAFPETPIVLNHCGGVLGIGRYAGRRHKVFKQWSAALDDLATCPNVMVKLGGSRALASRRRPARHLQTNWPRPGGPDGALYRGVRLGPLHVREQLPR
jgi:predicted TIM-barrel fold metal-dependent hydrolase